MSAASEQRTKTTIDDILETLKKLGVDDESETSGVKKTSSRLEWCKDFPLVTVFFLFYERSFKLDCPSVVESFGNF